MAGLESDFGVPVARSATWVIAIRLAGIEVDRNQCRAIAAAVVGVHGGREEIRRRKGACHLADPTSNSDVRKIKGARSKGVVQNM